MKKLPFFLLVCLIAPALVVSAGVEGIWRVENGRAHVEMERCGDELCGTIVWLGEPLDENGKPIKDEKNPDPALRDQPIFGLRIVHGFGIVPNKKGAFTGGRIYDADTGKTYRCTMRRDGDDTLKIRGYVGIPLFGKSTVWTRVGQISPEASPRTSSSNREGASPR